MLFTYKKIKRREFSCLNSGLGKYIKLKIFALLANNTCNVFSCEGKCERCKNYSDVSLLRQDGVVFTMNQAFVPVSKRSTYKTSLSWNSYTSVCKYYRNIVNLVIKSQHKLKKSCVCLHAVSSTYLSGL